MPAITLTTLQGLKHKGEKITMLTCYDATFAHACNQAGVEVLLVGDSLGMVLQGHDSTLPVTTAEMAYHVAAVKRGNTDALILADLPFMAYATTEQAMTNSALLMQSGAHMIKVEGALWLADSIRLLAERGIPVCAHMGLTPQSVNILGGYKVQGRNENQARQMRADAIALEQAGAAMLLLECVPSELAAEITQAVNIPVIGIGAGHHTDGQVLVLHDMLGLSITGRVPKFVKNFMTGQTSIHAALSAYVSERIGFVPTMGNLHSGHVALITKATQRVDFVVASIFVNPLQFGAGEDLDKYPRTLAADQEKLLEAGCDLLFAPTVEEMYPDGMAGQTRVSVPQLSEGLCGASRPGHFEGVATVVSKLFNMVQPDLAIFGQKDFQQLAVIRALVHDLNMPIQIIGEPTVRAADGLALSSRNGFLTEEQRAVAPVVYRTLSEIAEAIRQGERDYPTLIRAKLQQLEAAGLRPDYLEIRHGMSLRPATPEDRDLVILVAAFLGTTRLIDNLHLNLDTPA
eukprot:gene3325-3253_t